MVMSRRELIVAMAATTLPARHAWSETTQPGPTRALKTRFAEHFTGDFDAMIERRLIRLAVPYNPTLYFEDKGVTYGTAATIAQLFENWINKTFSLSSRPLTVLLTPVSRDKLFDTVLAG